MRKDKKHDLDTCMHLGNSCVEDRNGHMARTVVY